MPKTETDTSGDDDEEDEWVDRHSVNCFHCGVLVDERDCIPGVDNEGSICPKCQTPD